MDFRLFVVSVARENYWELQIKGLTVTRCLVDFSFGFELEQGIAKVNIHNSFQFITEGNKITLSPEIQTSLCPVLSIFNKQVLDAKAYRQGNLDILFSDNSRLLVGPDADYEAWLVAEADGSIIICGPGGGLTM